MPPIALLLTAALTIQTAPPPATPAQEGGRPKASQDELARMTPQQLAERARIRAANPNRPTGWWADEIAARPDDWYRSPEGRTMTANILSWQDAGGGWPLMNTTRELNRGDPAQAGPWGTRGALIKATVNEMRYLARAHRATGDARNLEAVGRGLRFLLQTQYPTGGWPHTVNPPPGSYERYATYNDDLMTDVMTLLREVRDGGDFAALPAEDRAAAGAAWDRGLDFILRTQITDGGRLTAWGQQYDEQTLEVRGARTFEPAAISGGESAAVLELLMTIEGPSEAVVRAVEAGCDWYDRSRITGLRVTLADGDRIARPDPDAPPVWARFYEIGTNRPIFVGRDGVVRYTLAEVEQERRAGYGWYNQEGAAVLDRCAAWRAARSSPP